MEHTAVMTERTADFIWGLDDLARLTKHGSPKVRAWACLRLEVLYGAAGAGSSAGLLSDDDESVLKAALEYLSEYPLPESADGALALFRRSKGAVASRAALLLARLKDERLVAAYEETPHNGEIADKVLGAWRALGELGKSGSARALDALKKTASEAPDGSDPEIMKDLVLAVLEAGGVEFILDYYAERHRDFGGAVVSSLLDYRGVWHEEGDLEGEKKFLGTKLPPAVESALEILDNRGHSRAAKELRRAFKKDDHAEVFRLSRGLAEAVFLERKALVGEAAFPAGIFDLLVLLDEKAASLPKEPGMGLALVAARAAAELVLLKKLVGVSVETSPPELLLDALFDDRDDVDDVDEKIMKRLTDRADREIVFDRAAWVLDGDVESSAAGRAARLLGLTRDERAVPCLVKALQADTHNVDLLDEAGDALAGFGDAAVDALAPVVEDGHISSVISALGVLGNIPTQKTVALLLDNWERLMTVHREALCTAVHNVGAREFMPVVRREIKDDEVIEAGALRDLCLVHGVSDPMPAAAEKALREREEEFERTPKLMMGDDPSGLAEVPLYLDLKCRRCERTYSYDVKEAAVDMDNPANLQIMDLIACKHCKAVNSYEVTPAARFVVRGRLLILMALEKSGKVKMEDLLDLGPLRLVKFGLMGGKGPKPDKEAMAHYEKALARTPDDPAVHIGFANMLLKKGRAEEAVLHYREALRLDPDAVEAYVQLGEIEEARGETSAAFEYFDKAMSRMAAARYYKVADPEGIKSFIVTKHYELRRKLQGPAAAAIPGVVKVEPARTAAKVGRNDPCPCGSGKKYKKCCLDKDASPRHKTMVTPMERGITDRITEFSFAPRFKKEMEDAHRVYFDRPLDLMGIRDEDESIAFGAFLEWFIHDNLKKNGSTVLEEFYQEHYRSFSAEERRFIEAGMTAWISVYEVTGVIPHEGLRLLDLTTGEEVEVKDVAGSRQLVKWDVICARVLRCDGANKLSGMITVVPRDRKDAFMAALSAKHDEFRAESGNDEWLVFMKKRGYLAARIMDGMSKRETLPFTDEHHPVVISMAEYSVSDFNLVRDRLVREFDFVLDEEEAGEKLDFAWLKRGRSEKWEAAALPDKEAVRSIIMKSQSLAYDGTPLYTVLGNLIVTPDGLTLDCISRERLARGKERLEEVLNDYIRHKRDTFKSVDEIKSDGNSGRKKTTPPGTGAKDLAEAMAHYMSTYLHEWLNSPLPALEGKSPLAAWRTTEGRGRVEEILKVMENNAERDRREGLPYLDVSKFREELERG